MKKNRTAISLMACLAGLFLSAFVLLTTCTLIFSDDRSSNNNGLINIANVTARDLLEPVFEGLNSPPQIVAKGANDFAFRLSAQLAENLGDTNFVFSPYSVWMPLAALVNATNNQNKAALIAALGAAGISEADLNRTASRLLYDLTKMRNSGLEDIEPGFNHHNPLKITNAIFVGNNVTLRYDFAQAFADFYRGSSINVDFTSRSAVDAVNRWASESTNGLITDLIQEFDPLTVAAIANAIYYSNRWHWEFNPRQTREGPFFGPAAESTAWYMLREGMNQPYYEDARVQAMPLSFKLGGGMLIILPKDGDAVGLLSSMTVDYFNEILSNTNLAEGKLLLPRFSIENTIDGLAEALIILGVPLFDEESAALTGGLIEENIPVWLSGATQKALIQVDEKGTTAAAVTILPAAGSAAPQPSVPFEMICNRPFVFILYESTFDGGNQVLFTGVVNRP
jgi:serpin B